MITINKNEIGRAGTFLVLSDLIIHGIRAIGSDEAFPYDIVAETENKLIKIQVKSLSSRSIRGKAKTPFYNFLVKQGKIGKKYEDKDVDGFALVMLDIKKIAYLPKNKIKGWSILLCDKEEKRLGRCNSGISKRKFWQDYTLEKFIKSI